MIVSQREAAQRDVGKSWYLVIPPHLPFILEIIVHQLRRLPQFEVAFSGKGCQICIRGRCNVVQPWTRTFTNGRPSSPVSLALPLSMWLAVMR